MKTQDKWQVVDVDDPRICPKIHTVGGNPVALFECGIQEENISNAILSAAAPELLSALVALLDEFDRYDVAMTEIGRGHEDYGHQRRDAFYAVAKATE